MDLETAKIISELGIDPATVPNGQVKLLNYAQIKSIGGKAEAWVRSPKNYPALAYSVDDEHNSPVGILLRNLHKGKDRSHIMVSRGPGPFWHNLHCSLPTFYDTGITILVEGPKDARVLWSNGIPAAAYLGPAPGDQHLRVIKRYSDVILWIPDMDQSTPELLRRKAKVHENAKSLELLLVEYRIPEKDPAELINSPYWFDCIRARSEELRNLI
jgi:hypothetical protein